MYCVDVAECVLLIKSLKVVLSCVIRLSIIVLQYGRQAGIIWKKDESSNKSKTSLRHAFLVYWYPDKEANNWEQAVNEAIFFIL